MSKSNKGAEKLWGQEAAKHFLRMPSELLYHFKDIKLTTEDFIIIQWIDFHQWGEKPAFPHPVKLGYILGIDEAAAREKLKSLKIRGYITLEPTANGSRNFHQDVRPTRSKLRAYLKNTPNHCEVIKFSLKEKGIDISNNRSSVLTDTSNSIDTSIPPNSSEKKTEAINDIIKRKKAL